MCFTIYTPFLLLDVSYSTFPLLKHNYMGSKCNHNHLSLYFLICVLYRNDACIVRRIHESSIYYSQCNHLRTKNHSTMHNKDYNKVKLTSQKGRDSKRHETFYSSCSFISEESKGLTQIYNDTNHNK